MTAYYVNNNAQSNGDHEVHKSGCYWLSLASNTSYLGEFSSCFPAVAKAKLTYPTANGCGHCSPACNTG
ncbi:MAG: hypothetical protein OXI76_01420 [Gemmatimonadota bacterium]|nr:hypothetical protein [Gemmatimonadota bacterium]